MPARRRVFGVFRRVSVWLAGLAVVAPVAWAQPLSLASDPAVMARVALGELRHGQAAAGVWRDGKAAQALVSAGDPVPAAEPGAGAPPLFEIGSISKVFTGLLLAQAVERGDLRLDDRLGDVLAGKVAFSSPAVASITLRQLVTHSSCLPRLPPDFREAGPPESPYRRYDRPRMWAALASLQLAQAPPCKARYSNLGFGVLGEILSERSGKPWSELVRESITTPLGMTDTVQHLGEQAPRLAPGFDGRQPTTPWDMLAFAGAGALRSTVPDLLRFSRAVLAGRNGPLGPAAERMLTPLGRIDMGEIGYGVWIRGPKERRSYFHEGWTSGYRSVWMVLPATQEALVLLTSNGQAQPWRVRNAIAGSYYPVVEPSGAPAALPLPAYAGLYRSSLGGTITVVAQDGVLYRRPVNVAYRPLSPAGPDRFVDREQGLGYEFTRKDGQPAAATVTQGGGEQTLTRIDAHAPALAVLPDAVAAGYAGRFMAPRVFGADLVLDVRASDGQLAVQSGNFPRVPVFPVPGRADRFAYEVVKAELQFERDAGGRVVALVLHQNGEHRAERVAD
ncbi:MAG: serine hydrolase [Burkholderiaceae bacterium]|nr:serine hydrolase [Burkholderiaceae bacterium]